MRIRHAPPLIALLLCLALAACTTTSQGEPKPETTTTSASTDSPPLSTDDDDLPTNGAPSVDNPLDTTRFQEDPCATLTTKQLKALNLPATGEAKEILRGVACIWDNRETRGYAQVGFFTDVDNGLSGAYAANERGEFPYFEPIPDIDGFPAVLADIEDRRARGICGVLVGATDQLAIDVIVQLSAANVGEKDPCEVVVDVAGMALQTMK